MSKKEKNPNNRIVDCYIAGYYGNTLMGLVYNNIAYSITSLQDKNESGAVYRTVDQIHEWIFWMSKKQIERAVAQLVKDGWVEIAYWKHNKRYFVIGKKPPQMPQPSNPEYAQAVQDCVNHRDQLGDKMSYENAKKIDENDPKISKNYRTKCPTVEPNYRTKCPTVTPIYKINNNKKNLCRDSKESLQRASQRKQACTTPPLAGAQQAACLTAMPAELSSLQVASASLGRVIRRKKLTSYSDVQRDATHPEPPQLRRTPPKQTKGSGVTKCPTITQKPQSRELPASHPDVKLLVPLLKQVHAKLVPNDSRRQWTRSANVLLGRTPHSDGAYSFQSAQEAALYLQMVLSFPWAGYAALTAFSFKFDNLRGIIDWKSAKMLRAMNLFLNRPVDSPPREIKLMDKNKYLQMVCPQYDIPWPVEARANVRKDGVNYFRGMKVDSEMGLLFNKVRDIMRKDAEKMKGEQ